MKKKRIIELHEENPDLTSAEIAEEVDTSPQYVREVWNEPHPDADAGATDTADAGGEADDPLAGLGDPDGEEGGGDGIEEDDPLAELIIEDDWDEYECDNCEAAVEYLQDTCDECGEDLAWWKVEA